MKCVVLRTHRSRGRREQRGTVAIIVALSAVVLFGFAGIAIDVGRLYVNKTELQTAADACALAASAELTCDPGAGVCPVSFLLNAQAAGIFAAGRNVRDFQVNPVVVTPADVTFNTVLAPFETLTPKGCAASMARNCEYRVAPSRDASYG